MTNKNRELLERKHPTMISIYMPTHRSPSGYEEDKIRLNNLISEAKKQVVGEALTEKLKKNLEELDRLKDSNEFLNNLKDGLAFFVDEEGIETVRFSSSFPEKVVVSDHFHILPLLNYFDIFSDYYVLDLSRDRFSLHELDSEGFKPVDLGEDVETRFDELFDDHDVQDSNLNRTDGSPSSYHGHQTRSYQAEKETEKFMRYIGHELSKFMRTQEPRPLLIFATKENVASFKEFTKNTVEVFESVEKPLQSMDEKEAIDLLKQRLLPKYVASVEADIAHLEMLLGQDDDKASENISRIAQEAKHGRIKTLFISDTYDEIDTNKVDEIVSDVILSSGEVTLINSNYMEFPRGVGAIYRY